MVKHQQPTKTSHHPANQHHSQQAHSHPHLQKHSSPHSSPHSQQQHPSHHQHHNHNQQQQSAKHHNQSQYNLHPNEYKTVGQQGALHTKSLKSTRKSLRMSPKSLNSSVYSPPLNQVKSRLSKSKRFDPHEVGPVTCSDYILLLIYYICLYAFFAAFWYSLWMVYSATVDPKHPRYGIDGKKNRQLISNTTFMMDDADDLDVDQAGGDQHLRNSRPVLNKTQLLMSLTDEQRHALSAIKCNDTLAIGAELDRRKQ